MKKEKKKLTPILWIEIKRQWLACLILFLLIGLFSGLFIYVQPGELATTTGVCVDVSETDTFIGTYRGGSSGKRYAIQLDDGNSYFVSYRAAEASRGKEVTILHETKPSWFYDDYEVWELSTEDGIIVSREEEQKDQTAILFIIGFCAVLFIGLCVSYIVLGILMGPDMCSWQQSRNALKKKQKREKEKREKETKKSDRS